MNTKGVEKMSNVASLINAVAFGKDYSFAINSGFPSVDKIVDFRSGNSYLIAGYEKSGKSSFALTMVYNLMNEGKKIAFFNTELVDLEFVNALIALDYGITKNDASRDFEKQRKAVLELKDNDKFYYKGIEDLSGNDNTLSFDKTIELAEEAVSLGFNIFFFDNLTTYSTQANDKQRGWEVLAKDVSQIISFTKKNNVVSFLVVHTRPDTVFSDTPNGIRKFIEDNNDEAVFEKSLTVIRRPSGSDIYGGGGIRSQVSGTILIWRPFQMFDQSYKLQSKTQVILENFRHARGGSVRLIFEGEKGSFEEV